MQGKDIFHFEGKRTRFVEREKGQKEKIIKTLA